MLFERQTATVTTYEPDYTTLNSGKVSFSPVEASTMFDDMSLDKLAQSTRGLSTTEREFEGIMFRTKRAIDQFYDSDDTVSTFDPLRF